MAEQQTGSKLSYIELQQAHVDALQAIPESKRKTYDYWLREYAYDWQGEVPYRLHLPGTFGLGSAPPFSPEFIGYIGHIDCGNDDCQKCREERNKTRRQKHDRADDARYRTTRAFRKLRRVAPKEFDAMYMFCMHGMDYRSIARSFNEEAITKDRPERYTPEAVQLLLYSGVDKVMGWW
jgi:hypothetical protein